MSKKLLFHEDSTGDAFTDLLFNALLGFAFMFFISFALIQSPKDGGDIESKAEFIIWKKIRNQQLGIKFRRQYPIGNFILFKCSPIALA